MTAKRPLLCIGGSSGAIAALKQILSVLPRSSRYTICVVLHRHPESEESLLRLPHSEDMPALVEPFDKEHLSNGAVYIAPPGYHMLVSQEAVHLSVDSPEKHSHPSIDVLFQSAAQAFGPGVVGLVLSGASADGTAGAQDICEAGGQVLVQDPQTCENATMPAATLERVPAARALPLPDLMQHLKTLVSAPEVSTHDR